MRIKKNYFTYNKMEGNVVLDGKLLGFIDQLLSCGNAFVKR